MESIEGQEVVCESLPPPLKEAEPTTPINEVPIQADSSSSSPPPISTESSEATVAQTATSAEPPRGRLAAAVLACLREQAEVFGSQALSFSDLMTTHQRQLEDQLLKANATASSTGPKPLSLPSVLTTRIRTGRYKQRLTDDFEAVLLWTLDSDGMVSSPSRVSTLIILMSRVTHLEHRALCLRVLSAHMPRHCQLDFVRQGGLRVLKRWIEAAQRADAVDELLVLVQLSSSLPFDKDAVLSTGIAKSIKRLAKHSSAKKNLPQLREAVDAFKGTSLLFYYHENDNMRFHLLYQHLLWTF